MLYHSYIDPMIGLSLPENVEVIEVECGLQHHINVSWEVSRYNIAINNVTISIILSFQSSHLTSVNQIISWHSSFMNDIIHYVNDSYYLLSIDYNETGPLEIEVTFSNNVCSKTTVIQYNSKSLFDHNIVSNSMIIFYTSVKIIS